MFKPSVALTSLVTKPVNEITRMLLASGTSMENLPSKSVVTTLFVPFTSMFTPGSGSPFEPVTVPLIVF
ncbi:hypothetical protein D3C86_1737270 [compost metagenome]